MTTLVPRLRGLLRSGSRWASGRALLRSHACPTRGRLPGAFGPRSTAAEESGRGSGKEKTQDRLSNWLSKKHRYLGSTPKHRFQTPAPWAALAPPLDDVTPTSSRVSADWSAHQPLRNGYKKPSGLLPGVELKLPTRPLEVPRFLLPGLN